MFIAEKDIEFFIRLAVFLAKWQLLCPYSGGISGKKGVLCVYAYSQFCLKVFFVHCEPT